MKCSDLIEVTVFMLLIKCHKKKISKTEQENTKTEKLIEEQRTLNNTHLLLLLHVLMNTQFIKAWYKITFAYLCQGCHRMKLSSYVFPSNTYLHCHRIF